MPTKEDILGALASESGPISRTVMAKKIGKSLSDWQKQLNGFEAQGLVVKNELKEYSLTDAGYDFLRASRRTHARLAGSGEGTPLDEGRIKEGVAITINIFC